MTILLFRKQKSEPEYINCDEFFLYRNENDDFKIHYTVLDDEKPEDYIYTPEEDIYMIEVIK